MTIGTISSKCKHRPVGVKQRSDEDKLSYRKLICAPVPLLLETTTTMLTITFSYNHLGTTTATTTNSGIITNTKNMNIKDYKETRDEDMHSYRKVICTTPTPPTPNSHPPPPQVLQEMLKSHFKILL